ncbi:uncharacterized protein [Hetaerina americana]|uniref:uncharacterized protein n=1 Tax=Hetaerina americana TaxID=62018 RepID=UPI003A7F3631
MIDDRKLIAEIKSHPLLYDPGVPENRDVNAKESTWAFIAKSLGYTVRECKMRWKSLRERFARERKKIIMTNHGEAIDSDDNHEKDGQNKPGSWHLMKEMYFLWNFVFHRNMNRSKSLLYLNANQDDQSNMHIATNSLSAPIWLLPSINHSNIPQTIQPQSVNQDDTSSECGETSTGRVKDPLSNDEDNSLCFDIGSSDSDDESRTKKRPMDESQTRSRIESTGLKRARRNSSMYTSNPTARSTPITAVAPPHQNDTSANNGIRGGTNVVIMSDGEKNQLHSNPLSEANRVTSNLSEFKEREDNNAEDNVNPLHSCTAPPSSKCMCQCGCKKQSEDELFCSSIAASMQRLTAKQRALLKLQIQKVLYEIEYPE